MSDVIDFILFKNGFGFEEKDYLLYHRDAKAGVNLQQRDGNKKADGHYASFFTFLNM